MIDIASLLTVVDDYVLIKMDESFPMYAPGDDVDLLVYDTEEVLKRIVSFYQTECVPDYSLRVDEGGGHCHADFLRSGQLDIRIDLLESFEFYRNISVRPVFMTKIFKDRVARLCGDRTVYVPSPEDDLTLRYFEYLEWFERRPDKLRHFEYVCAVEDEELKKRFFANTHRFIRLVPRRWPGDVPAKGADRAVIHPQSWRDALGLVSCGLSYLVRAAGRRVKHQLFARRRGGVERL